MVMLASDERGSAFCWKVSGTRAFPMPLTPIEYSGAGPVPIASAASRSSVNFPKMLMGESLSVIRSAKVGLGSIDLRSSSASRSILAARSSFRRAPLSAFLIFHHADIASLTSPVAGAVSASSLRSSSLSLSASDFPPPIMPRVPPRTNAPNAAFARRLAVSASRS